MLIASVNIMGAVESEFDAKSSGDAPKTGSEQVADEPVQPVVSIETSLSDHGLGSRHIKPAPRDVRNSKVERAIKLFVENVRGVFGPEVEYGNSKRELARWRRDIEFADKVHEIGRDCRSQKSDFFTAREVRVLFDSKQFIPDREKLSLAERCVVVAEGLAATIGLIEARYRRDMFGTRPAKKPEKPKPEEFELEESWDVPVESTTERDSEAPREVAEREIEAQPLDQVEIVDHPANQPRLRVESPQSKVKELECVTPFSWEYTRYRLIHVDWSSMTLRNLIENLPHCDTIMDLLNLSQQELGAVPGLGEGRMRDLTGDLSRVHPAFKVLFSDLRSLGLSEASAERCQQIFVFPTVLRKEISGGETVSTTSIDPSRSQLPVDNGLRLLVHSGEVMRRVAFTQQELARVQQAYLSAGFKQSRNP